MYCPYQPSTEYEYDFDGKLIKQNIVFNEPCTRSRCAAWSMYSGKYKYNNKENNK